MFQWLKDRWQWAKDRFNAATAWVGSNLSSNPESSNSRLLQTVIVFSIIPLVWIVVYKNGWKFDSHTQIITVTLIVSGAGAYAAGKAAER